MRPPPWRTAPEPTQRTQSLVERGHPPQSRTPTRPHGMTEQKMLLSSIINRKGGYLSWWNFVGAFAVRIIGEATACSRTAEISNAVSNRTVGGLTVRPDH